MHANGCCNAHHHYLNGHLKELCSVDAMQRDHTDDKEEQSCDKCDAVELN